MAARFRPGATAAAARTSVALPSSTCDELANEAVRIRLLGATFVSGEEQIS